MIGNFEGMHYGLLLSVRKLTPFETAEIKTILILIHIYSAWKTVTPFGEKHWW